MALLRFLIVFVCALFAAPAVNADAASASAAWNGCPNQAGCYLGGVVEYCENTHQIQFRNNNVHSSQWPSYQYRCDVRTGAQAQAPYLWTVVFSASWTASPNMTEYLVRSGNPMCENAPFPIINEGEHGFVDNDEDNDPTTGPVYCKDGCVYDPYVDPSTNQNYWSTRFDQPAQNQTCSVDGPTGDVLGNGRPPDTGGGGTGPTAEECAANPTLQGCQGTGGTGTGGGEGGTGYFSGGGTCESPPTAAGDVDPELAHLIYQTWLLRCSSGGANTVGGETCSSSPPICTSHNDTASCRQMQMDWMTMCAAAQTAAAFSSEGEEALWAGSDATIQYGLNNVVQSDDLEDLESNWFSSFTLSPNGACPFNMSLATSLGTFPIPPEYICQLMSILGSLVLAAGVFTSALILGRMG